MNQFFMCKVSGNYLDVATLKLLIIAVNVASFQYFSVRILK